MHVISCMGEAVKCDTSDVKHNPSFQVLRLAALMLRCCPGVETRPLRHIPQLASHLELTCLCLHHTDSLNIIHPMQNFQLELVGLCCKSSLTLHELAQ